MIKVTVRYNDHLVDIHFPCSENTLQSALMEIHAADDNPPELFVTDVIFPEELDHLKDCFVNLDELNYTEYTARKKKELKHDGYLYRFSPYDLVWNNDCYYIFGWSQKHSKIVKFRVDRMHQPKLSAIAYHPRPEDYDIRDYCERVFMMYEGKPCKVKLLCDNSLMKAIIDRFGEDVETHPHNDNSFSVVAEISASATFYSWVFTYGGKMKIVEPKAIRDEYERRLNEALKNR